MAFRNFILMQVEVRFEHLNLGSLYPIANGSEEKWQKKLMNFRSLAT